MNVESPLNYTGNKYKLLKQIQPLLMQKPIFLDLFAGSATVSINSPSPKIIINDLDSKIVELIKFIYNHPTDILLEQIDKLIEKYDLISNEQYSYSYKDGKKVFMLDEYYQSRYNKLREDFNSKLLSGEFDSMMLYTLIAHSFNHLIRYNNKGLYNMSFGKRYFNSNLRKKFILFSEKIKEKEVQFISKDFKEIRLDDFPKDTFIYCDPPYLITQAAYNRYWNETQEKDLLAFLDLADSKGYKFALSNTLTSKNQTNTILLDWLEKSPYNCYHLNRNYKNCNYRRKSRNSFNDEILITNYK